eukprot:Protomagalhaensia_sp_Gyna_25__799@NODE_1385_length_1891_cov_18_300756_g1114_i0_p1_GENE_NODE_1385_length_1891_cov_18_300756_g1114_i0NODE_1385_length_1891_cov_18_300756_g1114_i0_p1_ORF_typecomplete_len483_score114_67ZZ/PF00569_17/7_6e08FemAB/PF02388_16/0_62Cactin_mid/PF10312_9/17Cactin_mid/PF10312_9/0_32CarbpepA_inh/PF02977_15/1_2e03CarbpepA_inh/PF02977_15/0_17_NODE_1385_length_1891_cov_18_300756_g1114_i03701818
MQKKAQVQFEPEDETSSFSSEDEDGKDLAPELDAKIAETLLALHEKDEQKLDECKQALISLQPPPRPRKKADKQNASEKNKYTLAHQMMEEIEGAVNVDKSLQTEDYWDQLQRKIKAKEKKAPDAEVKAFVQQLDATEEDDLLVEVDQERSAGHVGPEGQTGAPALLKQYFQKQGKLDARSEFIKQYFVDELWRKGEPKQQVTVTELNLEAQEAELDEEDEFEAKYNHRFQEKGGTKVVTYARDSGEALLDAVKESARRRQRLAKRQRVQAEAEAEIEKLIEESSAKQLRTHGIPDEQLDQWIEEDIANGITEDSEWILCDGCQTPIYPNKVMFICGQCQDFTLCKSCQKKEKHEHSLRKSKVPASALVPLSWRAVLGNNLEAQTQIGEADALTPLVAAALRRCKRKPVGYKYIETESNETVPDAQLWREIMEKDIFPEEAVMPQKRRDAKNSRRTARSSTGGRTHRVSTSRMVKNRNLSST